MQVTGTIRTVFATQEGGYQGPSGYIYTFDMEIDRSQAQGVISGVIGSKTQPYPAAAGQPITVEVTQTDRGTKFKKINPQYAGQQQGPPQQGQARNPQQQKPDWDAISRGKVRCNLVCAGIQSGQLTVTCPTDCNAWMDYIFTGNTGDQGGSPNPEYNPNPERPAAGDDVPF